jgi:MFS family permease
VFAGSVLFAVFLAGWGSSLIWGPIADRWGRSRTLAAAVACYALSSPLPPRFRRMSGSSAPSAFSPGSASAGSGPWPAPTWRKSGRSRGERMGAGYLGTGYYAGFFLAAALNYTVGASFGWRAMFLCGGAPVLVSLYMLWKIKNRSAGSTPRARMRTPASAAHIHGAVSAPYRVERRPW